MRGKHFIIAFLCFGIFYGSQSAQALASETKFCLDPKPRPNVVAPMKAIDFKSWSDLDVPQKNLLEEFFGSKVANAEYDNLTAISDGKTAGFLAITNALSRLRFSPGTPNEISGLDLVQGIKEIRADRLILFLDVERIKSWLNTDLKYSIALNNSRKTSENGKLKFYDHTTVSAALHCGYDVQWYTKAAKAPHLHWNVRFSDGQADVHLDGYSPWIDNIFPNFRHSSYANSDVRYWYSEYLKKYGDAGFSLAKRN